MKLTYEDKVQIYELRKQGESFGQLSNQFRINISNLRYMIFCYDKKAGTQLCAPTLCFIHILTNFYFSFFLKSGNSSYLESSKTKALSSGI